MKNLISEIENSLPNGFHDADLYEFHVDFVRRVADFTFGIDVSDSEKQNNIIYRRGRLILSDLFFCSLEPPRSFSEIKSGEGLSCDAGVLEGDRLSKVHSGEMPKDTFAYWFFLNETNSFIYVAAKKASFEWLEK
jgi:hypothetical protein